jgi:hypothetical protein
LGVVLRIPLRGLFICPFAVAGLATRYLRTVIATKCGAPSRKPALIALSIDAIGGLPKLWCANLTLLIYVVCAYENPAVSTMGLHWVGPKQGPGRSWIFLVSHDLRTHGDGCSETIAFCIRASACFTWWLSIMCALWGHTRLDSGVVFATSSSNMGSVHKSVVGSLYPFKIILF